MVRGFFITGTDTECGKTEITLGLMQYFQEWGEVVLGMKPVASGAEPTSRGLRHVDAVRIRYQATLATPYERVNPYAFEPSVAPHLAAERAGVRIGFRPIQTCYQELSAQANTVLVEGVGGWRVPLGPEGDVSDLAFALGLPVILVVGLKLGCINHALLTAESILTSGLSLAGWVANLREPEMLEQEANISTLKGRIAAPLLGIVPHLSAPSPGEVAGYLDLPRTDFPVVEKSV